MKREPVERAFVLGHLFFLFALTVCTAWFSYAYFHLDEYFQVLELTRSKLTPEAVPILPWEHTRQLRSWLQPFLYWLVGRALALVGVRDLFHLAFAFRLLTGLANVGATALFLRTTLPWFSPAARRVHVRVATLAGFLPYLFVRTSSESASMAALTAGWALLLEGALRVDRRWSLQASTARFLGCGALFGVAFELRFQTAFAAIGITAWLVLFGRIPPRKLATLVAGGALALALGTIVDRWGYGSWTFTPWSYFETNILEGAAGLFGTDPPFAYFWMLPANVFLLVLVVLLLLAVVAWARNPFHPVTWATLPLFFIHCLVPHKEERFVFPIAILATALVTMAILPGTRLSDWAWERRCGWPMKIIAVANVLPMLLLAFVPIGWNHHVRFERFVHAHFGDELHATVFPEIDLHLPPFHPAIYDVDKTDPEELGRRMRAGTAREWLITDRPSLDTGVPEVDAAVLVYSELPGGPALRARLVPWVDAYNARVRPPLRAVRFRTLYRLR